MTLLPQRIPAGQDDTTTRVARVKELMVEQARLMKRHDEVVLEIGNLTGYHVKQALEQPRLAVVQQDEQAPPVALTVAELARRLSLSTAATYRLLEGGAVPGAFKTHPNRPGSRWFIPADAAERFLTRGESDR